MTIREPISYAACVVIRTELRRALDPDASVLSDEKGQLWRGKGESGAKTHVSLSTLMMALPAELV